MGWGGAGLGSKEQGIDTPISGGDVSKKMIEKCFVLNVKLYFLLLLTNRYLILHKIILICGFVLVVIIN